jgi:hypothetical protein
MNPKEGPAASARTHQPVEDTQEQLLSKVSWLQYYNKPGDVEDIGANHVESQLASASILDLVVKKSVTALYDRYLTAKMPEYAKFQLKTLVSDMEYAALNPVDDDRLTADIGMGYDEQIVRRGDNYDNVDREPHHLMHGVEGR